MPVTHTQTENTVSSTVLGLESIKPCGNVGYKEILLVIGADHDAPNHPGAVHYR